MVEFDAVFFGRFYAVFLFCRSEIIYFMEEKF